uniref:Uncharacterized protein n=1 Tax=Schistosoma mansoni TaxID=6183 RepID=A0A5K4FA00_SCHMA
MCLATVHGVCKKSYAAFFIYGITYAN